MINNGFCNNYEESEFAHPSATRELPPAGTSPSQPCTEAEALPHVLQFAPLRRRPAAPEDVSAALTKLQIAAITDRVMYFIDELCRQRGANVDRRYWKMVTQRVLRGLQDRRPLVCPARAGAGKSTWIAAFLLMACELKMSGDPLAELFSVLLVLQKIESLNDIHELISARFPQAPETLVVPLQGWTPSGQQSGFCKNRLVSSFDECPKNDCPFAVSCGVLRFGQLAGQAYILGLSQARFDILRKGDALARHLRQDENRFPRILIFDEKFEFAPLYHLTQTTLDDASSQLERLITQRDLKDRRIHEKQRWSAKLLQLPFSRLREQTCLTLDEMTRSQADIPFGMCSLRDADDAEKESFRRFRDYLNGPGKAFRTSQLSEAVEVIERLYRGDCLFTKIGAFTILGADEPQITFGDSLTLVFDATAEVDGDYRCLDADMLPSSPPAHMEQVHFHIYTAQDLNVSRVALRKSWKLPGFCALTEELLARYPGKLFLTTYKNIAADIPAGIDPEAAERLLLLDNGMCPYFGGTNGSNDFNTASLVMLLGYPRLSPQVYLERTFVYWRKAGIREQLLAQAARWSPITVQQKLDLHAMLPLTAEYESCHLAARLEQEIYRCQLRNAVCEDDIHVFLFAPPQLLRKRLTARFPGAVNIDINIVPDCIGRAKSNAKRYAGEPTAYARFAVWLDSWDHLPTPLSSLLRDTGIGTESWKKLRQTENFETLMTRHGAEMTGRGKNVKITTTAAPLCA